jgi:hypothetical protein
LVFRQGGSRISKEYAFLLDKGWVSKAEEFIARAATQSSMSGTPYQVRCAGLQRSRARSGCARSAPPRHALSQLGVAHGESEN